jgi:nicotinamidase-related amidase
MAESYIHAEKIAKYEQFLKYLCDWRNSLERLPLDDLLDDSGGPQAVGIACVDLIKGFTVSGRLASPRIARIVPRVVELFRRAYDRGVRDFAIIQDAHPENSLQFENYGPHCLEGSFEAEMVDELAALPFAKDFHLIPKSTTNAFVRTNFEQWLDERDWIKTLLVVGDCTDICVYQLAIHLRTKCVAESRRLNIVIPEDCVETYDLPVDIAKDQGILAHDGDFFHLVFLYHTVLNGVRVVSSLL